MCTRVLASCSNYCVVTVKTENPSVALFGLVHTAVTRLDLPISEEDSYSTISSCWGTELPVATLRRGGHGSNC